MRLCVQLPCLGRVRTSVDSYRWSEFHSHKLSAAIFMLLHPPCRSVPVLANNNVVDHA